MPKKTSDVVRTLRVFQSVQPRALRTLILIGGLAFIGGLSEAATLVMITAAAVGLTDPSTSAALGPLSLSRSQALWVAAGLVIVTFATSWAQATLIARMGADSARRARSQLLDAFHNSSYQRKSEDRLALLQEALTTYVDRFAISFNSLSNLLAGSLNLLSFAAAAVMVSPQAALALVFIGGLMQIVLRPASKRTRAASQALASQRRSYAEGATESVLMARELAVFGVTEEAGQRLGALDQAVSHQFFQARFLAAFTPKIYQCVAFALVVAGLAALGSTDSADLAGIGAVVLLLLRSLSYGQQLVTSVQQASESRPFVDRLIDLTDSYRAEARHPGVRPIGALESIDLDRVCFSYPSRSDVLTELDLHLDAGETLGLIGPSGGGKSTLVNLLLRLYEPGSGTISMNGMPLQEIRSSDWHKRTAIVPQDPRLLLGSIADNIRFLRPMDDDRVVEAARAANIEPFILSLPQGFDSPVGEMGAGLSGGQRQRICIARALAGRPDLLVLDEPTSALDGESEAAIQRTLEELKGKVTMIIVAHRISTLSICDRLAVLNEGRLTAVGTAAELAVDSPYFREAVRLSGL